MKLPVLLVVSRECGDLYRTMLTIFACQARCESTDFLHHRWFNPLQIEGEIEAIFDFLETIYKLFGFSIHAELSTRPEKFLGEVATWDAAENVSLCINPDIL